ncbi:MAG: hypothetical protein K5985_02905 [Lachnospiraceae bacterium]|nr:hypothetical protein [Lachnospiraceae bacterium]
MAIAGLLLGLTGLLTSVVFVGLLPGAVGLVLSVVSNNKKRSGTAIAGIVVSSLAVLIPFVLIFLYFSAPPAEQEKYGKVAGTLFLNLLPGESFEASEEPEPVLPETPPEEAEAETSGEEGAPESGETSESVSEDTAKEAYIPPDEGSLTIPEALTERTGFEPVRSDIETVSDEEAERLENELSYGETGDELEFDPYIYPYYAMLNEKEQHVYRQLFANSNALIKRFRCVEDDISEDGLYRAFSALVQDHPELFWMNTAYSGRYKNNGTCLELDLSFNRTADNPEEEKARFEEAAEKLLSGARQKGSDSEAERYVHDALAEQNRYSKGAEMNQSAYSALVNGSTVCAGYTRAFQYVMQKLGLPCYYCSGYAGENHAWDIIGLDDGFYNVDVTWDDTDDSRVSNYDFFNKTDRDYSTNHVRRELSVKLPPCNAEQYREPESKAEEPVREETPAQHSLPTLEERGYSEADVLHDMDSYYDDCYNQIVSRGAGTYEFTNVIEGEELFRQWNDAYDRGITGRAFSRRALEEVGGSAFHETVVPEKLAGGRYLLTHRVTLY